MWGDPGPGAHPAPPPAHPCAQLLSSPEVGSLAATAHSVLSLLVSVLVPGSPAVVLTPKDGYEQRVALLLMSWLLAGWVLPTLLLLRPAAAAAARAQRRGEAPPAPAGGQDGSCCRGVLPAACAAAQRAAHALEAALCSLLPGQPQLGLRMETSPLAVPGVLTLAVRWLLLIVPVHMLCCTVAPLYSRAAA